ncbi:MAG TPA: hypothetical protein VEV85_05610 [Bryobacteraceae bacterium]|nr:hypothetical protein [Bryobacteraceae bacterium]
MAFASEFKYEDELEELELLDSEYETGKWKTQDWVELHRSVDGSFEVRVSGFGWNADRPILKEKPTGEVLKKHDEAVNEIVDEIKKIFARGACVDIGVNGYVDWGSEWKESEKTSNNRADFFLSRIWKKLLGYQARVKDHQTTGVWKPSKKPTHRELVASGAWPGDTPRERMLNRRVQVSVNPTRC